MKTGLQQGHADGLCGLYAILNFMAHSEDWKSENPAEAMRYVLDAAQAEGWLTPHHITSGFEPFQLVAILNRLFGNYFMPFRATLLASVKKASKGEDFFALAGRVLSKGGSIIGGPPERDHWVLVTTIAGRQMVVNSSDNAKPLKSFDKRQPEFCSELGVVILPQQQQVTEIPN